MSTEHATELVNALKDIKETLATQTEHLKTNSLLLQALLELNQKEVGKRTDAEQRVDNEATKSPDVKVEVDQDSGQREQPRNKSRALYADVPPDFTLTWELTGKDRETHHDNEWYNVNDHKDKEWYHIDDHKLTTPRPLPCPPEEMHLSGNLYVPYSHSRTRRSIESRGLEIDAETTGLDSHAATIVDALNNLYSVPADARLPLCFEPLSLRRMKITGELDEYLIKATQFLKDLRQASGTFIIWDYDILGNHFCYYPSDLSWNIEDEQQFRLLMRRHWAGLDPYFDQLDAKRELIFDPGKHDSLLFDDRHFTQSRLYFWAINSLGRFIQDIDFTIERWETFWGENEDNFRRTEKHLVTVNEQAKVKGCKNVRGVVDKSVDQLWASILSRIQSLKNTRQVFESRRQKIIEYRDGLFNASSVIETREATRLSQNVKLLTFVSIFYLPLGFCMSMWSINENYNANNLVAVTICIGLATYVVVANLETTVYSIRCGLSLLVEAPRQRLVRKMTEESGTRWSFLGRELSRAQPSREDPKPSEWLVVGYWLVTIYRSFKSFRSTEQPLAELDAEQNNATREAPTSRNPINLLKRLRPRPDKDVEKGNPPTKIITTSLAGQDTTSASEPEEAPRLYM
ncbi:hypothetical protein NEUTE1DRAFT_147771 [Neurospora tetrasperma FGSC 2508]|uniref:Uncharacterized protein n=1 Tax=Neurospora tetrasperma (strain FGSC 2508 / ATCC MYA-4615 / P0657) TaxID=510951 RepID=F8MSZ0_NEUT8|nr:uncharacterized protein NEUTE1DRAFT_147771 [Neurospora tetrasperma FGSC 2508]EGO55173.1 hypothetical protein NEUTE1DRAFT_147771 [Neurospora tetrasperma FGSC 2508]